VAFGASVQVMESSAGLRELAAKDPTDRSASGLRREATDLEQALQQARAELRPGDLPRVVLFTDGRETTAMWMRPRHNSRRQGFRYSWRRWRLETLATPGSMASCCPDRLAAGGLVTATVEVGSQRAAPAVVELKAGDKILASKTVAISVGLTPVPLDVTFADAGAVKVEATVTVPGDPLGANNHLASEAIVGDKPRVLYVESAPTSAKYLQNALVQSGIDVTGAYACRAAASKPPTSSRGTS
jgi:hypothetical protein